MRGSPEPYRLTFRLPAKIGFAVAPGRHQPCLHGCVLIVDKLGLVAIEGPSRQRCFDQAERWLLPLAKDLPPTSIAATLRTPPQFQPGGSDAWTIIVGARIAFSPTPLEPYIPHAQPA